MKTLNTLKTICIMGLMAAVMFALPACDNSQNNADGLTGGVAATVNGAEIKEDDVTVYIKNLRASYGLTEQDKWGEYLASYNSTPEKQRKETIDKFIDKELVLQAMKEKEVVVEDSEVEERVSLMKANYETEEAWQNALTQSGLTDASYREAVSLRLQEMQLMEKVAPLTEPTDEEILEYLKTYKSSLDGARRSSHILFDAEDEALAKEVLAKLEAGELEFAAAAKEYSKDTGSAENGGDINWDSLSGGLVSSYQTELSALEEGKMSGLVTSEYGIHIILCTKVFTAPEEITSLDQVPQEFVEASALKVPETKQDEAYAAWLADYREKADIVINPMPENVPYNLDMKPYYETVVKLYDEQLGTLSEEERAKYYDEMGIPAEIYNAPGIKPDYSAQPEKNSNEEEQKDETNDEAIEEESPESENPEATPSAAS